MAKHATKLGSCKVQALTTKSHIYAELESPIRTLCCVRYIDAGQSSSQRLSKSGLYQNLCHALATCNRVEDP